MGRKAQPLKRPEKFDEYKGRNSVVLHGRAKSHIFFLQVHFYILKPVLCPNGLPVFFTV